MSANTNIEWTDRTWNPVRGCSIVSPGCVNCYAMKQAHRFSGHIRRDGRGSHETVEGPYFGLTKQTTAGPQWTGQILTVDDALLEPLRWRKPQRIFVNSMSDLFHEDVPDAFIERVFAVMALAPRHTFQILTKRADRMRRFFEEPNRAAAAGIAAMGVSKATRPFTLPDERVFEARPVAFNLPWMIHAWPLPNVWLGVSVEDQQRADERIPLLLQTPAAVRFVSAEPLLGPIDLWRGGWFVDGPEGPPIDWVIVGGESGPKARPMHPNWARSLRDQSVAGEAAFFFKQWGEWAPGECAETAVTRTEQTADWIDARWIFGRLTPRASAELHCDDAPDLYRLGKRAAGRLLDGVEWNQFPRGEVPA